MQKILPSLVLTLVCAVVCGLLAAANAVTKDKIAQAEAQKVQDSLTAVFGDGRTYTETPSPNEDITAVYESNDGVLIFDITVSGYNKDGIRALIGITQDGTVENLGIVSISETAGLGTKINDKAFLSGYIGAADAAEGPDAITGATYSSKGLRHAVELALDAYQTMKEAA